MSLIVTLGTLIYTIYKAKIKTYKVENAIVCVLIGVFLGIMSSFLGIGGGPINLVVLFFFFSMSTKIAAENSLYIIFFSQIASLVSTIISGSVPDFQIGVLTLWLQVVSPEESVDVRSIKKSMRRQWISCLSHLWF